MDAILSEIETLLRKYDQGGHADYVANLRALRKTDQYAFKDEMQGKNMWGGSGAVWDVVLYKDGVRADADNKRFMQAIVALVAALESEGLGIGRSRQIADTFRKWTSQGV